MTISNPQHFITKAHCLNTKNLVHIYGRVLLTQRILRLSFFKKQRRLGVDLSNPESHLYPNIMQCCGSGSGTRDRVLFDPWIRDPE
jgi:hypothetical protein